MNYLDAHSPYRVTKHLDPNLVSVPKTWEDGSYDVWEMNDNEALDNEYAHNYRELYGASIDYLDRKVSDLIQHMQNTTAQETTVVITADHGHNLGYPKENYLFGHNCTVSEGVLHVPLEIVNPPDGFPRQVEESFSHLDLGDLLVRLAQGLPSIDDLVGSYAPAEVEGFTIPGNKSHKFPGTTREWEHWDRMRRVCYVNHKKYEWDSLGNIKRYNIDRERPCWQALAEEDCELPAVADDLFVTGIKEYKRHIDSLGTDTGVKDDLQALGYI
jgi:arylsulfatase A-like enzyme